MPTRELQASRFRRCLMTAANLTLCGGQNSSAEIKGGAMRNWRLALMAGALSMAASSISASAQSVPNQYGGGFSLRLPLGDSHAAAPPSSVMNSRRLMGLTPTITN